MTTPTAPRPPRVALVLAAVNAALAIGITLAVLAGLQVIATRIF